MCTDLLEWMTSSGAQTALDTLLQNFGVQTGYRHDMITTLKERENHPINKKLISLWCTLNHNKESQNIIFGMIIMFNFIHNETEWETQKALISMEGIA